MNFQVGYTDNERNTSRILKPPGGGHSDIFGLNTDDSTTKPTSKPKPKSQISEIFSASEENGNANEQNARKKQTSSIVLGDDENENKAENSTVGTSRKPLPPLPGHDTETDNKSNEQMKTPNPKRVPPGGFSTILWVNSPVVG